MRARVQPFARLFARTPFQALATSMEQLFHQLGDIIVRAVPHSSSSSLLHIYLKKVLFKPLEKVLEERREKTQGAVEAAEAIVARLRERWMPMSRP